MAKLKALSLFEGEFPPSPSGFGLFFFFSWSKMTIACEDTDDMDRLAGWGDKTGLSTHRFLLHVTAPSFLPSFLSVLG